MSTRKDNFSQKDKKYMRLALNLANARHGLTGKNPSVGCVIVKDDEIVSIGQTGYGGRPHAEHNAINNSNADLKGSKIYVTLEPCNHYGQTSPCTNKIIRSKISEVIYSVDDIDLKVKSKSFRIFNSNKIKVTKGLLKKDISNFYAPYFFNRKYKIPYVTGKIAVSKNNLIYSKGAKRITDIYSDKFTHLLRYKNDALMISAQTLNKDNPRLNCRLVGLDLFSPKRIILDNNLKMKTSSYIFKSANKKNTIIFYSVADDSKVSLFKKKKIKLIKSNLDRSGLLDIKSILKKLYNLGCRNLLVEGGNELSKNIVKDKLFNQFYLYKSTKKLLKSDDYKKFNFFKDLTQNYKSKSIIKKKSSKDSITLYIK